MEQQQLVVWGWSAVRMGVMCAHGVGLHGWATQLRRWRCVRDSHHKVITPNTLVASNQAIVIRHGSAAGRHSMGPARLQGCGHDTAGQRSTCRCVRTVKTHVGALLDTHRRTLFRVHSSTLP